MPATANKARRSPSSTAACLPACPFYVAKAGQTAAAYTHHHFVGVAVLKVLEQKWVDCVLKLVLRELRDNRLELAVFLREKRVSGAFRRGQPSNAPGCPSRSWGRAHPPPRCRRPPRAKAHSRVCPRSPSLLPHLRCPKSAGLSFARDTVHTRWHDTCTADRNARLASAVFCRAARAHESVRAR